MTLDGLLTFFTILIAIYGLADPVQRLSLRLFVSVKILFLLTFLSFVCIIFPDLITLCEGFKTLFRILSFILPIGGVMFYWAKWHRGKLTENNSTGLTDILKTSLQENKFSEVERIIGKNKHFLHNISADTLRIFFSRKMVKAFLDSQSLLPLELLAEKDFFESYDARLEAVDSVTRESLLTEMSPLRSQVIRDYGGAEGHTYSREEREIMGRTYLNPDWYQKASAHYPLTISAMESLWSGRLATGYNQIGLQYIASQGISTRSRCPIFLSVKTQVQAIKEAIIRNIDGDFYVTDFLQLFQAIRERSIYQPVIWGNSLSNPEYPTPYAYLLFEIAHDLETLSCEAVRAATDEKRQVVGSSENIKDVFANLGASNKNELSIKPPGEIARQLAQSWAFCVWDIAQSQGNVSDKFRDNLIKGYLNFVLKLGFGPHEIIDGHVLGGIKGLDEWKNLFVKPLKEAFAQASQSERSMLKNVLDKLDVGKEYVAAGKQWLITELGL